MDDLSSALVASLSTLDKSESLVSSLTQAVLAQPLGQAHDNGLISVLNAILLPAVTESAKSDLVQVVATFLGKIFDGLPSTSTPDTANEESIDAAPTTPSQLLQTAILDVLWSIDVLLDANGQVWPPSSGNASESSPQRYKLRRLLSLLTPYIPLYLQKLRIALSVATDPATEGRIAQGEIRMRTSMFYKQQKFNLLREESEGYSKLVTELLGGMGPAHNAATAEPKEGETARNARAKRIMTNIQALIGSFDLDPTRSLDILLDIFSDNIVHHHSFFRSLLALSPWGRLRKMQMTAKPHLNGDTDMEDASYIDEHPEPDGSVAGQSGNSTIAQVLGFKFAYYQTPDVRSEVPHKLYLLAALLIWDGFVKLVDLYPHLSPDDESLGKQQAAFASSLMAKARSGTANALAMAGSLDASDLPSKPTTSAEVKKEEVPKEPPNQKVGLLRALLSIGDLRNSLFIFTKFPWLCGPYPDLADHLLRLMNVIIAPAYAPYTKTASKSNTSGFDEPKKRYSVTEHGLIQAAPLQDFLTGWACSPDRPLIRNVFFFSEWKDRLEAMQDTPSAALRTVVNLLKYIGCYLSKHMSLFNKLLVIGSNQVKEHQQVELWTELIRIHFLPALTVSDPTPHLTCVLWSLLHQFPYATRFSFYGEWKDRAPKLYPLVKLRRAEAERDTKGLLRRIGSDAAHNKKFGRQFAKIAHTDPCTIFSVALSQVQSYENLIQPIIEAARYLTPFEYDVLTFAMLEALSDPSRHRIKSDGMHQSLWLQGLSTFVALLLKKWPFDVSLPLEYVVKQLTNNNSADLVIIRDLIKQLGQTDATAPADVSENGLLALSGSKTLRTEFTNPTTLEKVRLARRNLAARPLSRLHSALVTGGLGRPLLVRIAKLRQQSVRLASDEEAAQIRSLGNFYDQIHSTLIQLIDYAASQLTHDDQVKLIPTLDELWSKYDIEPGVAFTITRSKVAQAQRIQDVDLLQKSMSLPPNGRQNVSEEDDPKKAFVQAADGSHNSTAMEVGTEDQTKASKERPIWSSILEEAIAVTGRLLPGNLCKIFSPGFFVTFWTLELYDIFLPTSLYSQLRSRVDGLTVEAQLLSDPVERQRVQLRIREQSLTLDKEREAQKQQIDATKLRLSHESPYWILSTNRQSVQAQLLTRLIIPRAKMSPADAIFCARFLRIMHDLGTPNFLSLSFYDKLFGDQLVPIIFHMSEDEVRNYARFLKEVIGTLFAWQESKDLYEAEALGFGRTDGKRIIGFIQKSTRLETPDAITEADYLSHAHYKTAWGKWQGRVCAALRICLESKEYMMIRNGLLVLIAISDYFPSDIKSGQTLLTVVKTLGLKENQDGGREDLKILAKGYEAILSKKARAWDVKSLSPDERKAYGIAPASPAQAKGPEPSAAQTTVAPAIQEPSSTAKPQITATDTKSDVDGQVDTTKRPRHDAPVENIGKEEVSGITTPDNNGLSKAPTGLASLPPRPGSLSRVRSSAGVDQQSASNTAVPRDRTPIPLPARPLAGKSTEAPKTSSSASNPAHRGLEDQVIEKAVTPVTNGLPPRPIPESGRTESSRARDLDPREREKVRERIQEDEREIESQRRRELIETPRDKDRSSSKRHRDDDSRAASRNASPDGSHSSRKRDERPRDREKDSHRREEKRPTRHHESDRDGRDRDRKDRDREREKDRRHESSRSSSRQEAVKDSTTRDGSRWDAIAREGDVVDGSSKRRRTEDGNSRDSIPTGPRGSIIPTGPKGAPTGPRANGEPPPSPASGLNSSIRMAKPGENLSSQSIPPGAPRALTNDSQAPSISIKGKAAAAREQAAAGESNRTSRSDRRPSRPMHEAALQEASRDNPGRERDSQRRSRDTSMPPPANNDRSQEGRDSRKRTADDFGTRISGENDNAPSSKRPRSSRESSSRTSSRR